MDDWTELMDLYDDLAKDLQKTQEAIDQLMAILGLND